MIPMTGICYFDRFEKKNKEPKKKQQPTKPKDVGSACTEHRCYATDSRSSPKPNGNWISNGEMVATTPARRLGPLYMGTMRLPTRSPRKAAIGLTNASYHRLTNVAAPGYHEALKRLSELQSNTATVEHLVQSGDSANAAAIPEMLVWLGRAGYTRQDLARLRHIHVAGTKGKGSVCAHATAMLRQYGTVGTYTSPHLVSPRERIAIDGEPVGQDLFADAFFDLWDRFTQAARREGFDASYAAGPQSKPFYFRFLTIMAWHIFLSRRIDSVVMECGIGGEHDATNVLPAAAVSASVITHLGLDHVGMLGDSVEEIAWQKAGIMKSGVKTFTMQLRQQPRLMEVLRRRASEKGAHLVEVDEHLIRDWVGIDAYSQGSVQKTNQALAVLAVREHLGMDSEPRIASRAMPPAMARGLEESRLRGRSEMINHLDLCWLLDGAHTHESLAEVARWLASLLQPGESIVLLFNQQGRDQESLLSGLLDSIAQHTSRVDVIRHAIFTRSDQTPLLGEDVADTSVQEKAAAFIRQRLPNCQTSIRSNIEDAVTVARDLASQHNGRGGAMPKVLVTGSFKLVGGVIRALEPDTLP